MKRKMSTQSPDYRLKTRNMQSDVIDLTRPTPSPVPVVNVLRNPVPSTSTIKTESPSSCSITESNLYTELQNLEAIDCVIRNTEVLFCIICDKFVDVYDGIIVRNCLHQICLDCIRNEILTSASSSLKCPIPTCNYLIQDREIRSLLTDDEYEIHLNKCIVEESEKPEEQTKYRQRNDTLYKELLDLEQCGLIHNNEPFECQICFTDIDVHHGILIRECLHQYCIECIRNTIILCEEVQIKCPTVDCSCYVHDREIHALLTPDEFDNYSKKTLQIAESQATNSYHCKLVNCEGWCLVDDEVNTFVCPRCSSENCLPCQAIHTGRNCQEYQDDLRYAGLTEDQKSEMCLDEIVRKKLGMRCTTCKIVIMKREGCDFLKCSMCKTELCWATKMSRWGPGGRGDTSGGCQCTPLKRCHPECRNCH